MRKNNTKKLGIFIFTLLTLFLFISSVSALTYQEDADETTCTGNLCDGDWGTSVTDVTEYFNYTKPDGAQQATSLWEVKDYNNRTNLTVTEACWNYDSDKIILRVTVVGPVCLEGDTEIKTIFGSKKIKDLKVGDYILSNNEITGLNDIRKVSKVFKSSISTHGNLFYEIHTSNGNVVNATKNHMFYTKEGLFPAFDLREGDILFDINGKEDKIITINLIPDFDSDVYDIEVEGNHNFYAENILVHNPTISVWYCYNGSWSSLRSTNAYLSYEEAMWWNILAGDETPPYFTTIPSDDSITYGQNWAGVDFDAEDETEFDSYAVNDSRFTINSTGFLDDVSILGAGSYALNITINDTAGNENSTIYTLTINKATLSASLTNDKSWTFNYDGTSATLGISESNSGDGDVTYKIYVDGIDKGSSYSQATVGTYSVILNSTGGANYSTSASLDSDTLTINKNTANCQVLFNETSPITYPETFLVWTDCNSDFTLKRNGTTITNNTAQILGAGTYNFSVQRTDTQNYSNTYDEELFTISKASLSGSISGTASITYGTNADIQGSESNNGDADVSYKLYRDGVEVTNPDASNLSAGTYEYIYNATSGENYTVNSSIGTFTLTVNQLSSEVNLSLNYTDGNVSIGSGDTIDLNCTLIEGDGTIYLYNDDTLINSGTSPIGNTTEFSSSGIFNITCIHEATINYTESHETWYVNVSGETSGTFNNFNWTVTSSNVVYSNGSDWIVFNNTDSNNQNITFNNLTDALIAFSNGSIACANISSCDDSVNITLIPGNYSYVLDGFTNLTEGTTRTNSPLVLSRYSDKEVHITNTLSEDITGGVDIIINEYCDDIISDSVHYRSDDGSVNKDINWQCYNDARTKIRINFTELEIINPSTTSNVISYETKPDGSLGSGSSGSDYGDVVQEGNETDENNIPEVEDFKDLSLKDKIIDKAEDIIDETPKKFGVEKILFWVIAVTSFLIICFLLAMVIIYLTKKRK